MKRSSIGWETLGTRPRARSLALCILALLGFGGRGAAQVPLYAGQTFASRLTLEVNAAVGSDRGPSEDVACDARRSATLHDVSGRVRVRCLGEPDGSIEVFQGADLYSEGDRFEMQGARVTVVPHAGFLRRSAATTICAYASAAPLGEETPGLRSVTIEFERATFGGGVLWTSVDCSVDEVLTCAAFQWELGKAFVSCDGALSTSIAGGGSTPEIHLTIGTR